MATEEVKTTKDEKSECRKPSLHIGRYGLQWNQPFNSERLENQGTKTTDVEEAAQEIFIGQIQSNCGEEGFFCDDSHVGEGIESKEGNVEVNTQVGRNHTDEKTGKRAGMAGQSAIAESPTAKLSNEYITDESEDEPEDKPEDEGMNRLPTPAYPQDIEVKVTDVEVSSPREMLRYMRTDPVKTESILNLKLVFLWVRGEPTGDILYFLCGCRPISESVARIMLKDGNHIKEVLVADPPTEKAVAQVVSEWMERLAELKKHAHKLHTLHLYFHGHEMRNKRYRGLIATLATLDVANWVKLSGNYDPKWARLFLEHRSNVGIELGVNHSDVIDHKMARRHEQRKNRKHRHATKLRDLGDIFALRKVTLTKHSDEIEHPNLVGEGDPPRSVKGCTIR